MGLFSGLTDLWDNFTEGIGDIDLGDLGDVFEDAWDHATDDFGDLWDGLNDNPLFEAGLHLVAGDVAGAISTAAQGLYAEYQAAQQRGDQAAAREAYERYLAQLRADSGGGGSVVPIIAVIAGGVLISGS